MRLSKKQKRGLEIVTGEPWDKWHPEAVEAYFSYTDRGVELEVSTEARVDYNTLISAHKFHPVTVAQWKKDFLWGQLYLNSPPLLFLSDFVGGPDNYVRHVFEIYISVRGYIPI